MIKWHKITCLTFTFLLSLSLSIFGQPKFGNPLIIDSKDGLPNDHVNDIVQDDRGFIWIGTHGGLSRFDGSQTKNYLHNSETSNSLLFNRISRILADGNKIWTSSHHGLSVLDVVTDTFAHYIYTRKGESVKTVPNDPLPFAMLYKDKRGAIWCGSRGNGFGLYHPETDEFEFFKYSGKDHLGANNPEAIHLILGIHEHLYNDSIMWFGTNMGLLQFNRFTKATEWFYFPHPDKRESGARNTFRCLYQHTNGKLYMGNWTRNIYEVDFENRKLKALPIQSAEDEVVGVNTIIGKNEDELWVTSAGGFRIYNLKEERITLNLKNKVETNKYYGVRLIDDQERLWLHQYNAAACFDPASQQFITESYAHLNTGLWGFSREVKSWNDGKELVVCAQQANGLYIFNRENRSWEVVKPPPHIFTNGRKSFASRQMIVNPGGGYLINNVDTLVVFDPTTKSFDFFHFQPQLEYHSIRYVLWATTGHLWLGTYQDGLMRWNPKTGELRNFKSALDMPEHQLYASLVGPMIEDSQQNIWARRNDGFSVYIHEKDTIINFLYPLNDKNTLTGIGDFAEDGFGRMWISDDQAILGYADINQPEEGIIKKINFKEENYTTSWIAGIEPDQDGNLWVLCTKNLIKLDVETLETTYYSFDYGLEESEFFSFGTLASGELYIGLRGSIVLVDPKELQKNEELPIPYVAGIEVLDKQWHSDTAAIMLRALKLKHNENFFSFDFSAKAITLPELTQFQYRLEPFNSDWIDARGRRFANYTNVPSGHYTFQLKAANNEGLSSDYIYELPVSIATPWWQSWWFRTLLLLSVSGIIYAIYKYRVFQIRKEERLKAEFQKQLSNVEMNALRAQMNPHFLFNCLNSIDSYIIKNETKMASEYLNKFARLVRLILQNSRSNYVNLKDELEALDLYMNMEALRFRHKFDYQISVDEKIQLENIEIPPMLIQPFIENAIWHGLMHIGDSHKGKIELILEQQDASLNCIIQDNGIGRAKSAELKREKNVRGKKSMGMRITKDRMEMIKKMYGADTSVQIIDLMDENGNAKGTLVELKIPI